MAVREVIVEIKRRVTFHIGLDVDVNGAIEELSVVGDVDGCGDGSTVMSEDIIEDKLIESKEVSLL